MDSTLLLVSAAGNRFALFDGFDGTLIKDPSALALHLGAQVELGLDGLLQLLPARDDGHCRMVLHNMDGSRASACGNGLRCIAMRCLTEEYVEAPTVLVETDCGTRLVEASPEEDGAARARAAMGPVRLIESNLELDLGVELGQPGGGTVQCVSTVDAGNPHCVLFVPDVAVAAVRELGALLERHPFFPDRTNVEFVEERSTGLRVRVWERGVGETRSCGTGAVAAALVAVARGQADYPVRVEMPGGVLVVLRERGELFLEGEVQLEAGRVLCVDSMWLSEPRGIGPEQAPGHEPERELDIPG